MNLRRVKTMDEMRALVEGGVGLECRALDRESACECVQWTLRRFRYRGLRRADRGVVRRFLALVTGLSMAQLGRRVRQYLEAGRVWDLRAANSGRAFARKYTRRDIGLLAEADGAFGQMSGKAMAHALGREFGEHGVVRYARLASISPSHIYNLRRSGAYRTMRTTFEKTRPTRRAIGERRAPEPNGHPGYVRVDTVHQGDRNGVKGVYLVNIVDAVTRYQFVGAVPAISENHMVPVLEGLLALFPFTIRGFHADNGSEFINHRVAGMLAKLDAELTRSRPRHCNDNALVEGKNAHVVRRHLGHEHIPAGHAALVHEFMCGRLSPFPDYHRPRLFPEPRTDAKGGTRRHYPRELVATPHEALKRLPDAARHLKPGVTLAQLDAEARAETGIQAAARVARERADLFRRLFSARSA